MPERKIVMRVVKDDLGLHFTGEHTGRVLAVGDFDGLHVGHRALIACLEEMALRIQDKTGERPVRTVLTFEPHPRQVLDGKPFEQIYSLRQKIRLLEESGMADEVIVLTFTPLLMRTAPEDFFSRLLVERYQAQGVAVGDNFSFGRNGSGTPELLKKLCEKAGLLCTVKECVRMMGDTVSSTRIRCLLQEGRIEEANHLLAQPYFVDGVVSPGKHLGRKIETPTVNLLMEKGRLLPKFGVYVSRTLVDGVWLDGISNVGDNPTFGGEAPRTETFLFDFSGDLYGRHLLVELLSFVRAEKKFEDARALQAQLDKDIEYTKRYFDNLRRKS